MANKSLFAIRHWDLPKLLLVTSGFFAIAALGFFLAVWLQLQASNVQTRDTNVAADPIKKLEVASMPSDAEIAVQAQQDASGNPVSASQADTNDLRAAAKIKAAESANNR